MELREAIKIAAEIATRPATQRALALTAIEMAVVACHSLLTPTEDAP